MNKEFFIQKATRAQQATNENLPTQGTPTLCTSQTLHECLEKVKRLSFFLPLPVASFRASLPGTKEFLKTPCWNLKLLVLNPLQVDALSLYLLVYGSPSWGMFTNQWDDPGISGCRPQHVPVESSSLLHHRIYLWFICFPWWSIDELENLHAERTTVCFEPL